MSLKGLLKNINAVIWLRAFFVLYFQVHWLTMNEWMNEWMNLIKLRSFCLKDLEFWAMDMSPLHCLVLDRCLRSSSSGLTLDFIPCVDGLSKSRGKPFIAWLLLGKIISRCYWVRALPCGWKRKKHTQQQQTLLHTHTHTFSFPATVLQVFHHFTRRISKKA